MQEFFKVLSSVEYFLEIHAVVCGERSMLWSVDWLDPQIIAVARLNLPLEVRSVEKQTSDLRKCFAVSRARATVIAGMLGSVKLGVQLDKSSFPDPNPPWRKYPLSSTV